MTVHTVEQRVVLNDMLRLFSQATSGAEEIDVSFPLGKTIVCYPQSEGVGDVKLHPLRTGEKNIRIRAKGKLNEGTYDSLEIFLPYYVNCMLDVTSMCEQDDRYPNGIKTTPCTRWTLPSSIPVPDLARRELGIHPNGTVWNYRGILLLFYDEKYWVQWPL